MDAAEWSLLDHINELSAELQSCLSDVADMINRLRAHSESCLAIESLLCTTSRPTLRSTVDVSPLFLSDVSQSRRTRHKAAAALAILQQAEAALSLMSLRTNHFADPAGEVYREGVARRRSVLEVQQAESLRSTELWALTRHLQQVTLLAHEVALRTTDAPLPSMLTALSDIHQQPSAPHCNAVGILYDHMHSSVTAWAAQRESAALAAQRSAAMTSGLETAAEVHRAAHVKRVKAAAAHDECTAEYQELINERAVVDNLLRDVATLEAALRVVQQNAAAAEEELDAQFRTSVEGLKTRSAQELEREHALAAESQKAFAEEHAALSSLAETLDREYRKHEVHEQIQRLKSHVLHPTLHELNATVEERKFLQQQRLRQQLQPLPLQHVSVDEVNNPSARLWLRRMIASTDNNKPTHLRTGNNCNAVEFPNDVLLLQDVDTGEFVAVAGPGGLCRVVVDGGTLAVSTLDGQRFSIAAEYKGPTP